ncbi:ATP synthase subunit b [Maioricimonas rarisocia]|uniref:ATP synthase subunit b n=1 Tax=Maioricimonas rarisocia TaxID=2528026 RepID=A0A517Z1C9_9PLAN|nr:F0F1 ATP synthase subunit B [Maioricimonas rarisocia]QDU36273.1 ATP synthase subunit b [Maioricimonas rarisocia]
MRTGRGWLRGTIAAAALAVVQQSVCLAAEAAGESPTFFGVARDDTAFWSLVTFVLFLLVLKKLGWSPFVSAMSERERKEAELIAAAEAANRESQELLNEQQGRMEALDETLREVRAEAQRDADHTRKSIRETARSESEALNRRSRLEIERSRDQALNDLFERLADKVVERTEQTLRAGLGPSEQEQLVDQAVTDFVASRG